MATKLSVREKKVLKLITNSKNKYGKLALDIEALNDKLTELQEDLLFKTLTNEVSDQELINKFKELDEEYQIARQAIINTLGIEEEVITIQFQKQDFSSHHKYFRYRGGD